MMESVSTFARSSGITRPVWMRNGFMAVCADSGEPPHVDEMPGDRGACRHGGTYEMRAAAAALPALRISIRCRRAALAGFEPVIVPRQAHRASGLAPFETGVAENPVQAFGFRLRLHEP